MEYMWHASVITASVSAVAEGLHSCCAQGAAGRAQPSGAAHIVSVGGVLTADRSVHGSLARRYRQRSTSTAAGSDSGHARTPHCTRVAACPARIG
eukprot:6178395-Pleurochrysis_carterae.AAC.1